MLSGVLVSHLFVVKQPKFTETTHVPEKKNHVQNNIKLGENVLSHKVL